MDNPTIEIWTFSYQADALIGDKATLIRWLSPKEQAYLSTIIHPQVYIQFLYTRALSKMLTIHYYPHLDPFDWELTRDPMGKPYLLHPEKPPPLHLTWSHTHHLIAFAYSFHCPLGIDVECLERHIDLDLISRSCFSSDEQLYLSILQDASEKKDYFFKLWTLKEAFSKAVGLGLRLPFRNIVINEEKEYCQLPSNEFIKEPYPFFSTPLFGKYYLALVYASFDRAEILFNHLSDLSELGFTHPKNSFTGA